MFTGGASSGRQSGRQGQEMSGEAPESRDGAPSSPAAGVQPRDRAWHAVTTKHPCQAENRTRTSGSLILSDRFGGASSGRSGSQADALSCRWSR